MAQQTFVAFSSFFCPWIPVACQGVCPVEIPYRSIQAYSGSDASIFEPFGGSGTTLIAAEKASRERI